MTVFVISTQDVRLAVGCRLTNRDGDGLAVAQREHQVTASHWTVNRGGINNADTFGDGLTIGAGGQRDTGRIEVIDDGVADAASPVQVFVVAASIVNDADRERCIALTIFVISAQNIRITVRTCGANRDGDGLAIAQREYQVTASHWTVNRGSINNANAFGNALTISAGGQRDRGGVSAIHNGVADDANWVQVLIVAASIADDADRKDFVALQVFVISTQDVRFAVGCRLTNRDGDGLAVAQCEHQVTASHWTANHRSVNNANAFGDVLTGCRGTQRNGGGVGIIHNGITDATNPVYIFVVAANGAGDTDSKRLITLLVFVISTQDIRIAVGCRGSNRDRNSLAIGQGNNEITASNRRADRGGVDNANTFGDVLTFCSRTQRDGSRIRVIHNGVVDATIPVQVFVVATNSVSNADCERFITLLIFVIGPQDVRIAVRRSCSDRNDDSLAVAESNDKVATSNRRTDCSGVDDTGTFGDILTVRAGSQCDGSGICIIDDGVADTANQSKMLVIAPRGARYADCKSFGVVCVLIVRTHSADDSANAFADRNNDTVAVAQSNSQRTASHRRSKHNGVSDAAAFDNGSAVRGRTQRDTGAVYRIRNRCRGRRGVNGNQNTAARSARNRRRNSSGVLINIVFRWNRQNCGSGEFTGWDDNRKPVGQSHCQISQWSVSNGGCINNISTGLGDAIGGT